MISKTLTWKMAKAKARIWPGLAYCVSHRSTAVHEARLAPPQLQGLLEFKDTHRP